MAKRRSDEARVLDYFTSAPVEKVELMFGLVRDVVRKRLAPARSTGTAKRTRVGKATASVPDHNFHGVNGGNCSVCGKHQVGHGGMAGSTVSFESTGLAS